MKKLSITIESKKISYSLRKSRRARRMRIAVYCDGAVVVTAPHDLRENIVERFIHDRASWLFGKLEFFSKFATSPIAKFDHGHYLAHKEEARTVIEKRVKVLNNNYGFKYAAINIKNQKTRWGSCSRKGNLNFNYKLIFLPEKARDYVIVHELCHLKEFNHSKRFWKLVERVVTDYGQVRMDLNKMGLQLR